MDITNLKRRLVRLKEQRDQLESLHKGNEPKYTYWGGFELGYVKGKITELENFIDDLEIMTLESKQADKGIFIDAIDAFFEEIEGLDETGSNNKGEAHTIHNTFLALQKNLNENYPEAKGSWYGYSNWFGDYDGVIFLSYVDFEGGLHSYTIELATS